MKFSAYLCARLGLSADQKIRIVPSLLVNQVLSCEMKGTENLVDKQPGYTGNYCPDFCEAPLLDLELPLVLLSDLLEVESALAEVPEPGYK
ncbi:Uncharacterised protein (plasmid) [Legionella adelaidensis]|uniref:Uncharacterized protein n=1 Tax=Legionella adelaidensis TaxID=45056 RepID=A0A0W0R366_9GAMM|nr:hypothetical protein Lade_0139 [Legionella adelaidensis]VEH84698.1 Uncharacterised protein [Legionella adelaidensis]